MARMHGKFLAALSVVALLVAGCGSPEDSSSDPAESIEATGAATTSGANAAGSADESACASPDFAAETPDGISQEALPARELEILTQSGGDVTLDVEIADDAREMSQGLMFRESLGEDCGMLFAYPEERDLSFWMRNTLIPLSIAFADAEGRIVNIQDMEALDDVPPGYDSGEPARYALEANVGYFEENGVSVGDTLSIPSE